MINAKKLSEEVAKRMSYRYGEEFEAVVVEKTNGVKMYGIRTKEYDINPTFYVKDVEDDFDVDTFIDETYDALMQAKSDFHLDIDDITSFDKMKSHITLRLVNKLTPADFCIEAPDYMDDLIMIPYIEIKDERGIQSIKISTELMIHWNVNPSEVVAAGKKNSMENACIKSMGEVLSELMGFPFPAEDCPFYVLSNKDKHFGAIAAVVLEDVLKDTFKDGYRLIPLSVHEMLLLPNGVLDDNSQLRDMIIEVNESQVSEVDRLSDHPYEVRGVDLDD